jgi:hypothetical protein
MASIPELKEVKLDFELPEWAANCSKDAELVAWALMRVAAEVNNASDAIDSLHNRLDGIEKSLDLIGNELPNAGRGS